MNALLNLDSAALTILAILAAIFGLVLPLAILTAFFKACRSLQALTRHAEETVLEIQRLRLEIRQNRAQEPEPAPTAWSTTDQLPPEIPCHLPPQEGASSFDQGAS